MKLSDAIATGRVLGMETNAYTYCGCALSIGLRGAGKDKNLLVALNDCDPDYAKASDQWHLAELREWPWLKEVRDIPAWVRRSYSDVTHAYAYLTISDIFTMVTRGTATLDQLIDWVRSVEPEEAPSPTDAVAESCSKSEVGA